MKEVSNESPAPFAVVLLLCRETLSARAHSCLAVVVFSLLQLCKDPWDAEFIDKIGEDRQTLYDLILVRHAAGACDTC